MRSIGWVLLVGLVFATSVARSQTAPETSQPSITLPAALARVLADYENAWIKNDPAALAQLFAEDGVILPAGGPMVRGRNAILRAYSGPNKRQLSLRAIAFAAEGDTGYIIGGFSDRASEPDRGKFTLTLRRNSSGRWLIMSDMDNGNRPQVCPGSNP